MLTRDRQRLLSGVFALLGGIGLILADLVFGLLERTRPQPVRYVLWLPMLVLAFWGCKQMAYALIPGQRRLLEGRLNRDTFHMPKEGMVFVGILMLLLLAAMMGNSNNMVILVFCMLAGPFVINGWTTFTMLRSLRVARSLPRRVMAGEPFAVQITLGNRKWFMPAFLMAVHDRVQSISEKLQCDVLFLRVPARREQTTPYQLCLPRRGRYTFGPIEVTSRFPLGLVERGYLFDEPTEVLVYPTVGVLAPGWKMELRDAESSAHSLKYRAGNLNDEFHHIREYRRGDDTRSIHWKTSARRDELMVREFRQDRDRPLILGIDLWSNLPAGEFDPRVELACSLATTIGFEQTRAAGESGLRVILEARESQVWGSVGSSPSLETLLDMLAVVEPTATDRTAAMVGSVMNSVQPSVRVVIVSTRPAAQRVYREAIQEASVSGRPDRMGAWQIIEADPAKAQEILHVPSTPQFASMA